ncbi:FMN-binding negative transcriptional regulator [Cryptosporangium aurantiacum]|uniref:Negative transcriptional regulator, PaiB family n=1 Tax=Cryptosporangium aurantiacum TaxID=134849 RepID=A0A1M7RJL5_9ACTN|nr:FMN-binding negative transcriptional regulator [Cryptosporangium aurantiacum]SHN46330.1 negative transcriptional regulator, PaiB family [Cryptosporangium aurantiacum]
MYQPTEFRGTDPQQAYAHIARYPFGILVSAAGLAATHLPFLLNTPDTPTGVVSHFALRNGQWRTIGDGEEVLVIFPGPDAYVSPRTYTAEEDVPTWNYTAVHLRGAYRRIDRPSEVRELLERTVATFEARYAAPWSLSSMDGSALESLGRAVVAFEVTTRTLEHGLKLSQDKLPDDVRGVCDALSRSADPTDRATEAEMRRAGVTGRTGPASTDPATWLTE